MTARSYVLDANALIGWFEDRGGTAGKVERLLEEALRQDTPLLMSAINWGEVFYISWRVHGEERARQVEKNLHELPINVVPADRDRASRAAALKQKHKLAYADAFAAELAVERRAWLVSTDPEFEKLGKILFLYPLPRYEK